MQLRINDIEAPTAQVQTLRPDEVLRVEYIDNPDMRYANTDVEAVINYVVKRMELGVAGGFNLTNAVTIGFGMTMCISRSITNCRSSVSTTM